MGTAIAGTILVSGLGDPKRAYGAAMIVLAVVGLIGLGATCRLPSSKPTPASEAPT
jgi:hypothetical protein